MLIYNIQFVASLVTYYIANYIICNGYSSTTDESKTSLRDDNNDDLETDGDGVKHYYHRNCESPGLIIFTVSDMSSKLYIFV